MKISLYIVFALSFLLPAISYAHPGRTDSSGCHTCRTNCVNWGLATGEYHCHNAKAEPQPEEPVRSIYNPVGAGTTVPAPEYKAEPVSKPVEVPKPVEVQKVQPVVVPVKAPEIQPIPAPKVVEQKTKPVVTVPVKAVATSSKATSTVSTTTIPTKSIEQSKPQLIPSPIVPVAAEVKPIKSNWVKRLFAWVF